MEQGSEVPASAADTVFRRAVIIGANGAVGRMFARHLSDGPCKVAAVDCCQLPHSDLVHASYCSCDGRNPDEQLQAALQSAQVVILAIPESAALETVPAVAPFVPRGSLIVDTTSVKSRICPLAAKLPKSIHYLSINPMFAPSAGFAGQNVAVVTVSPGGGGQAFRNLMEGWGARTTEVGADEHDRITAAVQVATHAAILAFGMALLRMGHDTKAAAPLMTPPHRTLLALLERVTLGAPEVYWEIQSTNPFGPGARAALTEAVAKLSRIVRNGDAAGFRAQLEDLKLLLHTPTLHEQ